ncbi:MAG: hypothetical protein H0V70_10050, partial [Ktedonobacteraceae bacterium]|nr:hypothetical protein [Ktedonobacteraceae bacterium]
MVGKQKENLEQAISYYHEALHVFTVEAFPRESRNVHLRLAEIEAQHENWDAAQTTYKAALKAEDLLVILGTGTLGRDAILKEGGDAAIRLGYALHRLGHINDAAVAMERGRARGLAEALAFDAADPALITDEERKAHYRTARANLVQVQADLHAPL